MRFNLTPSLILFTTLTAQASYLDDFLKHAELSGAGGLNWISSEDTHLVVSPSETDKNKISDSSPHGTWKAGFGYSLMEDHFQQRKYLNRLLLELNVYQVSNTVKGKVWQYELPQFDNYKFSAPLTSTRLMFDVKPTLMTWNKLSPYLIVGAGASWNKVSYEERPAPGINPNSALSLSHHTQTELAWDLGAGLNYQVTEDVSLTAEYIYGFLGEGEPGENSANGRVLLEAPNFSYQIQSLLFGVSVKY
jgi:opacity protein-like surface antigen